MCMQNDTIRSVLYPRNLKQHYGNGNKVISRFYVSRFYVKKSDDQIQNLRNMVSQFYVISRFSVGFGADQQYRKNRDLTVFYIEAQMLEEEFTL